MTEYLCVLPMAPETINTYYLSSSSLKMHCTVMHWFRLRRGTSLDDVRGRMSLIARSVGQPFIELVSKEPALFGPHHDVPCHILERNDALNLLHTKLFKELAEMNCEFNELRWVGAGYRPHVTSKRENAFLPGMKYSAGNMLLIEKGGFLTIKDSFCFA